MSISSHKSHWNTTHNIMDTSLNIHTRLMTTSKWAFFNAEASERESWRGHSRCAQTGVEPEEFHLGWRKRAFGHWKNRWPRSLIARVNSPIKASRPCCYDTPIGDLSLSFGAWKFFIWLLCFTVGTKYVLCFLLLWPFRTLLLRSCQYRPFELRHELSLF